MDTKYIKYRTSTCKVNYCVVWTTKHRKKVLTGKVEIRLKDLIQQIAEDKGFKIESVECYQNDNIRCLISAPPKLSITAIVTYLKGISGRILLEEFPDIRAQLWKGELWNHSYFCETVGIVSDEAIKEYIERQNNSY